MGVEKTKGRRLGVPELFGSKGGEDLKIVDEELGSKSVEKAIDGLSSALTFAGKEIGKEGASGMGAIEGLGVQVENVSESLDCVSSSIGNVAEALEHIAEALNFIGREINNKGGQ